MKLTVEPCVILGTIQKTTFTLKVDFDSEYKSIHENLEAFILRPMFCYNLLAKARKRADAFIRRQGLIVDEDNTSITGIDMIVYHDVDRSTVDKLPLPSVLTLDECDLENFDFPCAA